MRHSLKVGLSFGLTSGVITTLGLLVGLNSTTNNKLIVIGGILTIAIADSMSDAMGIHISEESENIHTNREIWESTFSTLFGKFIISSSFIIPIITLNLSTAVIFCIIYGLILLSAFSYMIGKYQKTKTWKIVIEHLIIGIIVIVIAHYVGCFINSVFC